MELRPETKNGSGPFFGSADWRDQKIAMKISELVSELRATFLMSDFDRVEEALVAREARFKAEIEENKREIGSLQEKIEVERMDRISVELELKRVKEEREKEKRARESYEKLVKVEENSGLELDDKIVNTIYELKNKNLELEYGKCKLEELKRKWVDDRDAIIAELRNRNRELEDEKKKWVDDRDAVAELRTKNRRLADENRKAESLVESWKRKFCELNERVKFENTEAEPGVPLGGKEEKKINEIDVRGSASLKRNEDVNPSFGAGTRKSLSMPSKDGLGASAKGRLALGSVIEIKDSDEDECNSHGDNERPSSSGAVQQKILPTENSQKRKTFQQKNFPTGLAEPLGILEFASSREFGTNTNILDGLDSDTSGSSCSSGSLDMDSLPLSSLTRNKKMRTEAASLD